MQRSRVPLAVILIALGLVWIGQGTAILKGGSFMVGDPRWAWIGAVCVVGGIALVVSTLRSRARPR